MEMAMVECKHKNVIEMHTDKTCRDCGVVISSVSVEKPIESRSITNLYERHMIGSKNIVPKTDETKILRKYFHNDVGDSKKHPSKDAKYLSKFSNSCQKLSMNKTESEYALMLFQRGKKGVGARQYPLVAVWAIYKSCHTYGIPLTDREIKTAVRFEFNRKFFPDMAKILFKMMEVQIPEVDKSKTERYYFKLMVRKILGGWEIDEGMYSANLKMAWNLYNNVYTEGSYRTRARQAITQAFEVKR